MAIETISYEKKPEEKEDKSFLGQIAKPLSIAQSAASIYSSVKPEKSTDQTDAMERRKLGGVK